MRIQAADFKDLRQIAKCHREAFPGSLSSQLGLKYAMKMLEWYLSTPKAFLIFIQEKSECVGYCGGMIVDGTLPHGSASSMAQYSFHQALQSLLVRPWLLMHYEFLSRYKLVLRNIFFKISKLFFRMEVRSAKEPQEPYASLIVIGVRPSHQGKGYGTMLLNEFEALCRKKGLKKLSLTVKSDNAKAIRSYTNNKWIISAKKEMTTSMVKRID